MRMPGRAAAKMEKAPACFAPRGRRGQPGARELPRDGSDVRRTARDPATAWMPPRWQEATRGPRPWNRRASGSLQGRNGWPGVSRLRAWRDGPIPAGARRDAVCCPVRCRAGPGTGSCEPPAVGWAGRPWL